MLELVVDIDASCRVESLSLSLAGPYDASHYK
jgi:hypothetical protein